MVSEVQHTRDEIIRFESMLRNARASLLDVINTQTTGDVREVIGSDTEEFTNMARALGVRLRSIQAFLYGVPESV